MGDDIILADNCICVWHQNRAEGETEYPDKIDGIGSLMQTPNDMLSRNRPANKRALHEVADRFCLPRFISVHWCLRQLFMRRKRSCSLDIQSSVNSPARALGLR